MNCRQLMRIEQHDASASGDTWASDSAARRTALSAERRPSAMCSPPQPQAVLSDPSRIGQNPPPLWDWLPDLI